MLAFQVHAISGPPSYSEYTPRVCSAVAGKRNKQVRVCVCVSTLIDYRYTAGLVGYSRQWKWAWTPLRKQDISNTHTQTHTANTHMQLRQTQPRCDFIEKSSHAQDFKAHFVLSHTHAHTYVQLDTPHTCWVRKLSSKDERRRRGETGRRERRRRRH